MALMHTEVPRKPDQPQARGDRKPGNMRNAEPMAESTLQAIVKEEIHTAIGFVGGDISEDRRRAMDYYLGDPFGNEQEGRSAVVSSDVQDTIEAVMPDLVEIFAGGDIVVRYEPENPEDEEFAKQATEYANYIWNKDNDGFGVTHDWIKDALLQKNGVIKIYWDESERVKHETFENLNVLSLQRLLTDDEVEVLELTECELDPANPKEAELLQYAPDGLLYDVKILRRTTRGRCQIVPVPPEEFLIARRSVSLHGYRQAEFTCHKTRKTVSDLLQMGFDEETVRNIPSHDEQDYNEERVSRFDDDEWPELDDSLDPAMREIWLYECYLKVDFDGDGVTEMRQVTVAGPGWMVLENIEVDDHPFASITPIRMPHKFFGRALADLVQDIQLIKSTIQRQLLDNMYRINNGRNAISNKVELDDMLVNRPGGIVRIDTEGPDVAGHIAEVRTEPLGPVAFSNLEYMDTVRETRTGISRLSQGLDPDALNKTASGMNMMLGRTQKRLLLIARVFAETGFSEAFKKILKLVVTRQDRPRVIRLRNEWIPMDPKVWNANMDVSVSVGLGSGTKEQQNLKFTEILQLQMQYAQMQGGLNGPLVTWENVYETTKKKLLSMGEKSGDLFFSDPTEAEPPEEPPDPKLVEVQGKQQEAQARLQLDSQKMQIEAQQKQEELGQNQLELGLKDRELDLKEKELTLKYATEEGKLNIEREKAGTERAKLELEDVRNASEIIMERDKHDLDERTADQSKELGDARKVAESAEQAMLRTAEQFGDLADRISKIEGNSSKPKKVTLKRGKDGRITGASVKQGDTTSIVEIG